MKAVTLCLFLAGYCLAGNFQAKNDTVPQAKFYLTKEDSAISVTRIPPRETRRDIQTRGNTCAWSADCPVAEPAKKEERHVHERKVGPRWRKPAE